LTPGKAKKEKDFWFECARDNGHNQFLMIFGSVGLREMLKWLIGHGIVAPKRRFSGSNCVCLSNTIH